MLLSGPEILRNKVHTGWAWQILLRKNLRNILIQKIHHKSTLQISGPNRCKSRLLAFGYCMGRAELHPANTSNTAGISTPTRQALSAREGSKDTEHPQILNPCFRTKCLQREMQSTCIIRHYHTAKRVVSCPSCKCRLAILFWVLGRWRPRHQMCP